jgi:hypothetical protein
MYSDLTLAQPDMYYIAIPNGSHDKTKFIPVKAKQVIIPGWEDLDLFVHRPYLRGEIQRDGWTISEASTGQGITTVEWGRMPQTQRDAKVEAERNLNHAGREMLATLLRQLIDKYGLSPRYRRLSQVA